MTQRLKGDSAASSSDSDSDSDSDNEAGSVFADKDFTNSLVARFDADKSPEKLKAMADEERVTLVVRDSNVSILNSDITHRKPLTIFSTHL